MIQDTYFSHATLPAVTRPTNAKRPSNKSSQNQSSSNRPHSRELDGGDGHDVQMAERGSLASFGSGNTTDSAHTLGDSQRNTVGT